MIDLVIDLCLCVYHTVFNVQDRYVVRLADFGNLITVNSSALLPEKPGLFNCAPLQVGR